MKGGVEAIKALKALPVSAVILDGSGTIIAVNRAWKDFGRQNGLHLENAGVGTNYLTYCETDGVQPSGVAEQIRRLIAGQLDLLTHVYPCDSPTERRWFVLIGVPLSTEGPSGAVLLHVNFTELLPGPIAADAIRIGTANGAGVPSPIATAVVGAVEHSVAEALSSGLMSILVPSEDVSAPEGSAPPLTMEEILASGRLSKRQLQILRLLGEGKTNAQIAEQLFRSPNTIKLHVSAILQRLELHSRTQAALLASRLTWPADGQ